MAHRNHNHYYCSIVVHRDTAEMGTQLGLHSIATTDDGVADGGKVRLETGHRI